MYTVKIDISDWGCDEVVTIETGDFEKVQMLQEFIEFQQEHGWAADYDLVLAETEEGEELEAAEGDEPSTITKYLITKLED
jgi:hypothetical protein